MSYREAAYSLGKPTHIARASRWPGVQVGLGRGLALFIILGIVTTTAQGFFAAMALWVLFEAVMFHRSRVHLLLAANGLVHVRNRRITPLHWRDIEHIRARTNRVEMLGGRLKTEEVVVQISVVDGKRFTFSSDQFPTLPEWREALLQQHLRHHRRALQQQWAAGELLHFGSISVSHAALVVDGRELPWEALAAAPEIDAEHLRITPRDGDPLTVALAAVPNAHLLAAVIEMAMPPADPTPAHND